MTSLAQTWRALARRPLFTAAVIVTMTAGIGVTTTVFSIVDRILIRPLPFPGADQLVSVYEASPAGHERTSLIAPARLGDWNRLNRSFDVISGSYAENVTDTSGAEPERLQGRRVMPRYFDVFSMPPILGRTFIEDEERFGGSTALVISEALWTRRFARNPGAIGQRLTIGGRGYTIVGIMPRTFTSAQIDVWVPAQLSPFLLQIRDARFLGGVGRMKHGVTLEQARNDLLRVQHQLAGQYPATDKDWSVLIQDLKDVRVGDYRRALLLLLGAVALLLVIAIANVAGLMLVQLRRRATEFAIRSAIGASQVQIAGVVMREVLMLTALGGAGGTALAVWLTSWISATFSSVPRMSEVAVDGRAIAFAAGASVIAAAAFGLLPALYATRRHLVPLLSAAGRGVFAGRHRLQGALVVAQIALSVLLAGAAGLLVRSYGMLTNVPSGFDADRVLTFHVGAAWDEDRTRFGELQARFVAALQQLPGVRAAGYTNFLPATGATLRYQVRVDGLAGPEQNGTLLVGERTVTSGYLQALQVPLVAGEWCPAVRADPGAPRTAMVNRRFVEMYGGGADLIGRNLIILQGNSAWRVVGILGNIIEDGASAQAAPYAYICMPAGSWPDPEYVVRADADPRAVQSEIRQLVRTLDPTRPLFGMRSVEDVMGESLDQPRLNARFLAMFAGAALALSALGLHGLLTLLVAERRRELGVRMALGASPRDLVRLILSGAGRLIATGLGAGLILTVAAGSVLRGLLFGVTAYDPRALASGILALTIVSALAIAIPARQAAGVDPLEAMRLE